MKREELEKELLKSLDISKYDDATIEFTSCESSNWKMKDPKVGLRISVKKMYEFYEPFTFKNFDALSKLFNTEQIDIGKGRERGGCSTCDYGSSYEIVIDIYDSPITIED